MSATVADGYPAIGSDVASHGQCHGGHAWVRSWFVAFRGWPAEALEFFEGLEADNSRNYWTSRRTVYERQILAPMQELLAELEPEFGKSKIHRPYRDIRFSADKSPYKTAISASLESGGYVHLSAKGLFAGAGMWMMDAHQLDAYRRAVADEKTGEELQNLVSDLRQSRIEVGGHEQLKTAPKGYAKDHPRIDLLRNKGLVAWKEWPAAAWLGNARAKARIVEFLRRCQPLNAWLEHNVGPSPHSGRDD
jgi:uncharacterized protein (TIGR02453 family)